MYRLVLIYRSIIDLPVISVFEEIAQPYPLVRMKRKLALEEKQRETN